MYSRTSIAGGGACAVVLAALVLPLPHALAAEVVSVETTSYTYNSDGALTSITKQQDDQPPVRQFVTWDNFTPDGQAPTTGSVSPGNGHVVAIGFSPGVAAAARSFEYDAQERLNRYGDNEGGVDYRYHPTWTLAASTLDSGDARRFFYHLGKDPQMCNIEETATGDVSGRLGPLRAFKNGGSQILLSPRKDVSAIYDPEREELTPYHYDPFGDDDDGGAAAGSQADLDDNPYQYAGEYKDPTWSGYYLRARWYSPGLHSFLSRDPERSLNRYGYSAGNPVSRIDPSGRKYKSWPSRRREKTE